MIAEIEADLRSLEEASSFNLFEAVGLVGQEIRHSHFLAFLLDPKAAHGLGVAATNALLGALFGSDAVVDSSDEIDVLREVADIDLRLVDKARQRAFVIENKVWHVETPGQLQKYEEISGEDYPDTKGWHRSFVLLSPAGTEATRKGWISRSYADVRDALDTLLSEANPTPDVALAIRHYRNLLSRYVLAESSIATTSARIWLARGESLRSALEDNESALRERFPGAARLLSAHETSRKHVAAGLASELVSLVCDEIECVTSNDESKTYHTFWLAEWESVRLKLSAKGWRDIQGFPLFFELGNYSGRPILSGAYIVKPGDAPDALREKLFEKLVQLRLSNCRSSLRKSGSTAVYEEYLVSKDRFEAADWETICRVSREEVAATLIPVIRDIAEAVREIEWPDPE